MTIFRGGGDPGVAAGGVTNAVPDGDYGNISVSNNGGIWTIDNGVVETANLGGDVTTAGKALLDDATAADQRTTLGLGTVATQDSNNVSITGGSISGATLNGTLTSSSVTITGGSISGITDLAVADGGTGASTAAQAKINLEIITGATGSLKLPIGPTAQRDASPAEGYLRYNDDFNRPEIYAGSSWSGLGGATGAGGDDIFYENGQMVTTNYTITAGKNAGTFGPITINSGVTVTVGAGSTWTVI